MKESKQLDPAQEVNGEKKGLLDWLPCGKKKEVEFSPSEVYDKEFDPSLNYAPGVLEPVSLEFEDVLRRRGRSKKYRAVGEGIQEENLNDLLKHREIAKAAENKTFIQKLKDNYARLVVAGLAVSLLWFTSLSFVTFIIQDVIFPETGSR